MGEHSPPSDGGRGGWRGRTVRLAVAAALAVAAVCAVLLAVGRTCTVRSPSQSQSADCAAVCARGRPPGPGPGAGTAAAGSTVGAPGGPGSSRAAGASQNPGTPGPRDPVAPGSGTQAPTGAEQRRSSSAPAPPSTPPAAASTAPISASARVQFTVTSHWDDGYRAAVTVTNTGAVPLTGWHLTFLVTGATLHQPTDTGETAMSGGVVTVTPAAWRPVLAAGGAATFGFGFDGALAAPAECRLDGLPCELTYVSAVAGQ